MASVESQVFDRLVDIVKSSNHKALDEDNCDKKGVGVLLHGHQDNEPCHHDKAHRQLEEVKALLVSLPLLGIGLETFPKKSGPCNSKQVEQHRYECFFVDLILTCEVGG